MLMFALLFHTVRDEPFLNPALLALYCTWLASH